MDLLQKISIKYVYNNEELYLLIDDVVDVLNIRYMKNNTMFTRWNTINKYLRSIGYLEKVHSNSYIPLNVFYKLVFMTNTKQAKELKNEIADIISTY